MIKKIIFFLFICFYTNISLAETEKKLKFFNIDLHIAVIGDLKNLFEELGHSVESNSISGHAWLLEKNKHEIKVISSSNWQDLNPEMVEKFYQEYKNYLNQFDGFIVTHAASFALLYEKFDKPIIIVNSTRYSNMFIADPKRLKWLNDYLKKGVSNNKIFYVSNNKGDQAYLKYYTGIESELIPSLCYYTKAKYTGKKKGFILKENVKINTSRIFKHPELISKIKPAYKWQDLYDYQGIIHFPYQISTMSLFEQYSANVPLFFPTKDFLIRLHNAYPKKILSDLSFNAFVKKPLSLEDSPDNIKNKKILKSWIDNADFYDSENMPYIQYFNSFSDLENLLEHSDLRLISSKMAKHNQKRKEEILEKWKVILEKVRNYKVK